MHFAKLMTESVLRALWDLSSNLFATTLPLNLFIIVGFGVLNTVLFIDSAHTAPQHPLSADEIYRRNAAKSGYVHRGISPDGTKFEYWIGLPPQYAPGKPSPTIAFFHCRGWGQNAYKTNILDKNFEKFRKEAFKRGYILLGITYGENSWMNLQGQKRAMAAIKDATKRYSIDPARLYGMGISMGGCGCMILAMNHPRLFRALCDIAGISDYTAFYNAGKYNQKLREALGGSPTEVPKVYKNLSVINFPKAFVNTPVCIIHGNADRTVPVEQSKNLARVLRKTGVMVNYLEVPGVGHSTALIRGYEKVVLDFFETAQ